MASGASRLFRWPRPMSFPGASRWSRFRMEQWRTYRPRSSCPRGRRCRRSRSTPTSSTPFNTRRRGPFACSGGSCSEETHSVIVRRLLVVLLLGDSLLGPGCETAPTPCMLANAHGGPVTESVGVPYAAVYYPRAGSQQGTCPDDGSEFAERPHRLYAETFGRSGPEPREVGWTPDEFAYDPVTGDPPDPTPVSYTHLRAHETPEHLVCRLLLEKKKKT